MTNCLTYSSRFEVVDDQEVEYLEGATSLFGKIFQTIGVALTGVGEIVGGICLLAAPEPTTLSKIGGVAAIVAGVGTLMAIEGIWDE